jgi:hypothetical protein
MLDSDRPYSAQARALSIRPLRISPEVRARVIETHSGPAPTGLYTVTDPNGVTLQGVKELSPALAGYWQGEGFTVTPWEPCNCEHITHFAPAGPSYTACDHAAPAWHEYMKAPAGALTIDMIGAVCDYCAMHHRW